MEQGAVAREIIPKYIVGDKVNCINNKALKGNDVAPPLIEGSDYMVVDICLDAKGNQHLDVGLVSKYNYITSIETGEELPNGKEKHWCHPSRFVKK